MGKDYYDTHLRGNSLKKGYSLAEHQFLAMISGLADPEIRDKAVSVVRVFTVSKIKRHYKLLQKGLIRKLTELEKVFPFEKDWIEKTLPKLPLKAILLCFHSYPKRNGIVNI